MLIPDNGKFRKRGIWDYCFRTRCVWFAKCGQAVNPVVKATAIMEGKKVSILKHCPVFKKKEIAGDVKKED